MAITFMNYDDCILNTVRDRKGKLLKVRIFSPTVGPVATLSANVQAPMMDGEFAVADHLIQMGLEDEILAIPGMSDTGGRVSSGYGTYRIFRYDKP